MKRFLLAVAVICCGATLSAATGATTPKGWLDHFGTARQQSKQSNRPILLLVTGSDWCPYCVKLKKNVLDKPEFKKFAKDNLILVFADSPSKTELPSSLVKQNNELAKRFEVRGYPTTIIIAPDGSVLGRIGGYTTDYLERVKKAIGKK